MMRSWLSAPRPRFGAFAPLGLPVRTLRASATAWSSSPTHMHFAAAAASPPSPLHASHYLAYPRLHSHKIRAYSTSQGEAEKAAPQDMLDGMDSNSDAMYDSGDELFAGVDANQLAAAPEKKRPADAVEAAAIEAGRAAKRARGGVVDDDTLLATARHFLQHSFGFDDFRHEQEAAIKTILKGDNSLVVFPTGAGKSLCYQIPALAFGGLDQLRGEARRAGPGVTIVVSPLIALMKDQTDALKRRGIAAECDDSTKTMDEVRQIAADLRAGQLRLLYCSPEKLNNEGFVERMKHVPGGVRLVAVDEAHCISEWGHSFRPEYLKVARFVDEIRAERVICLTATATPRVADDICRAFHVAKPHVYRTSPYRPNLHLEAEAVTSRLEKMPKLTRLLHESPGPTIVYVTLQKQAEHLAADLRAAGVDAEHFHAGMRTPEKTRVQDAFMAGRTRVVVATIAFGMGIDKADIRNVVHWDLANTVEEYSQQIGRAGRDGKPSRCVLYLCRDDFYMRENFARGDLPSRASLRGLLADVFAPENQEQTLQPDGTTETVIKLGTRALTSVHDIRPSPASILMATLELRHGLLRAITPEYSTYQWTDAESKYESVSAADDSPAGRALAAAATKARTYYRLDLSATAAESKVPRAQLLRKLHEWQDAGALQLKASGVVNRYRVLKPLPTGEEEVRKLADDLYADMEAREKDALKRTQQVVDLLTGDECFAQAMVEHFGEERLPAEGAESSTSTDAASNDADMATLTKKQRRKLNRERASRSASPTTTPPKTKCGHCTHCRTGAPVQLPPKPPVQVDHAGIQAVLDACPGVRDDPRFLARVAFGIKSPRTFKMGLERNKVFGSLAEHEFGSLLGEFERACEREGGGGGGVIHEG